MVIWTLTRCAVIAPLMLCVGATNLPIPQAHPLAFEPSDSAATSFTTCVRLTGLQESPPAKTNALGYGTITVSGPDGPIAGTILTRRMRGTKAYIQRGAPGRNGPPIVTLEAGGDGVWMVPYGPILTPDQYQSFLDGDLYMNVESDAHPGGEVRGQLEPIHCGARPQGMTPLAPAR